MLRMTCPSLLAPQSGSGSQRALDLHVQDQKEHRQSSAAQYLAMTVSWVQRPHQHPETCVQGPVLPLSYGGYCTSHKCLTSLSAKKKKVLYLYQGFQTISHDSLGFENNVLGHN